MEALISVSILGFVGVILVAGVFTAVKGNSIGREQISAESLARYELEYVRSVISENWSHVPATATWQYTLPGTPPAWDATHTSLPPGYTGYTLVLSGGKMDAAPYSLDANIEQITARVLHGGRAVLQMQTYITRLK